MKVFLSGYGKMGRMLEELALERGWEVVGHADITCPEAYETAPGADVCLDFSGVGASAFWLWWISTISLSQPARTPAYSCSIRRNTAMPVL